MMSPESEDVFVTFNAKADMAPDCVSDPDEVRFTVAFAAAIPAVPTDTGVCVVTAMVPVPMAPVRVGIELVALVKSTPPTPVCWMSSTPATMSPSWATAPWAARNTVLPAASTPSAPTLKALASV